MAAMDYRHCDVCGCKAFYDADLDYDNKRFDENSGGVPGNVGAWVVLCVDCAKTHEIKLVARKETKPAEGGT